MNEIKNIITDIEKELNIINERLRYNRCLWIGSAIRAYKFHNCKTRLENYFKNLDQRYQLLISILSIEKQVVKNNILCVL